LTSYKKTLKKLYYTLVCNESLTPILQSYSVYVIYKHALVRTNLDKILLDKMFWCLKLISQSGIKSSLENELKLLKFRVRIPVKNWRFFQSFIIFFQSMIDSQSEIPIKNPSENFPRSPLRKTKKKRNKTRSKKKVQ
jgi:hypothetical protein